MHLLESRYVTGARRRHYRIILRDVTLAGGVEGLPYERLVALLMRAQRWMWLRGWTASVSSSWHRCLRDEYNRRWDEATRDGRFPS